MEKCVQWGDPDGIVTICNVVKQGKIILGTTDTVLGLMGMTTKEVYQQLNRIKQRKEKPYLILVDSVRNVKALAWVKSLQMEKFLHALWPGPVTVILKKQEEVPAFFGSVEGTIAVRVPQHAGLLVLLKNFARGLFSTSANVAGQPVPTSFDQVPESIKEQVSLLVDGRGKKPLVPSTIIDCTGAEPKLIREGAYPWQMIQQAFKKAAEKQ